ncbi:MAG TPA: DUF3320 domain-containing protein [Planctomycetota bacterium]|nr:DUF3320 domain-containing protein [Planctomycetota bacterium]
MISGLSIELRHEARLCFAMQQSAVPWLHAITLQNRGNETLADLQVTIGLAPGLMQPHVELVAAVPAGGTFALTKLDPRLDVQALANLLERQRAELRITVTRGAETLASATAEVEVLAYNEWPGLGVLPALLAAFVSPNHPSLAAVLRDVGARLQRQTGSSALDGYQRRDPARVLAIVEAVHDAVGAHGITYVNPPPSFERSGQKVRTPEQVLGDRLATCLDLALLGAAILEHAGLHPLVVLQQAHALVGVWLHEGSTPEPWLDLAVELRKRCDLNAIAVVECTLACGVPAPFAAAQAAARKKLADDAAFVGAIDIAAARRAGIQPLPPRTLAFVAVPEGGCRETPAAGTPATPSGKAPAEQTPAPRAAPVAPAPPKDRLEHWKSKLLDLSLWNRLLNFAETKKTIRLCAHDLEALEDRLQQGRVRVHPRPSVGQPGQDPRDLELAEQRSGVDVMREYLAEELRAGRLRADLDAAELDPRLVEIFRHARTSLEESGANTLYLAVGFLKWYETPQTQKPRYAPLLLLPLVVERLSVQDGIRFVLDDAEPRLNQTLLQMLQRDHDLRVEIGETPPEDDNGVDVRAVLDAFRRAAVAMPRWEVETAACIGFFSFTKYLMWLDLASREALLQSPVLRHLIERPGAAFAQEAPELARDDFDDLDPSTVFCPKDADSSQLAAVLSGAGGRSFVLEGPPGTGKSQTITNLVAQSLANGKRVLFVAEKRAALEVVQRRLAEVGLGAFCLELHSSKSGSKAVLEQLRRPLELGQRREPAAWQQLAMELQQQRDALNQFVRALHRRREHGGSVFAAMAELVQLAGKKRVQLPDLLRGTPASVETARAAVAELAAAASALSVPANEPWWGVRAGNWTPALAREVVRAAERLRSAVTAAAAAVASVAETFDLRAVFGEAGPSRAQFELLLELARLMRAPSLPPSALLRVAEWSQVDSALSQVLAAGKKRDELWALLAPRWRRELLGLDLDRLASTYRGAVDSFFVLRWWHLREPRRELATVTAGAKPGSVLSVLHDLEQALAVRAEERTLATHKAVAELLGAAWRAGFPDWAQVEAWLVWVRDVRRLLVQIVPGAEAPDPRLLHAVAARLDERANGADALSKQLGALQLANDVFTAARGSVSSLLDLDADLAFGDASVPGFLPAVAARIGRWLEAVPRLRDHCAYRRAAAAATSCGLDPLVREHGNGNLRTAELQSAFRRTFLEDWLDTVHDAEPLLSRFRGLDHERAIARFAELDRQWIQLAAEVVVARLCAQLPQVRDTQVASSELGVLERELKKQRRHKPVRRLLAEIPGLLTRLAPCVLMSPLSVAQFLGRAGTRFDLIVFDEASQIPMWDAVGAIGRGRSVVVVGDSRQLPPTTFFQRLAQGDEPAPEDIPEDLESVLDECGAAGLPRQHLDWHYRSRHESLIAFSNHHYYQNRLLTFPGPQHAAAGLGVRCVLVDGVYDRAGSQQNRVEAEALVAEVVQRLRDPTRAGRSLGIVTFSQAQQVLIEDLLDAARKAHAEIEPAFGAIQEPVFVKNLENVQGDERDVILFSICYGPDAAGRIYENYGPLNQQGGERRLNVAITRARRELVVFTSVRPEQVATRTQALGAQHLRVFLDYALRGQQALAAAVSEDPSGGVDSPFEAAVRLALTQRGYVVHTQVGCSGYRIDLAIVDPRAAGHYLLGIECDGAFYHAAATARDRDRLRASVLTGLGWRLHRIWSTDFWQDPAGELERVEAAIAAAKAAPAPVEPCPPVSAVPAEPAQPPRDAVASPSRQEAPPPDPDGPRPYAGSVLPVVGTPEQFAEAKALVKLGAQAEAVLTAESPLSFDRFARALALAWGIQRVTERVRERVRDVLSALAVEIDGVLWRSSDDAQSFRGFRVPADDTDGARAADELPLVEVMNAMAWLLRQHHAMAGEDLAREAARCFGITRLGAVARDVMQRAVERLVSAGRGVRDGEVVRLP